MTISADYGPLIDSGNGTTTAFAVTFPFDEKSDLKVTLFNTAAKANVAPPPMLNGIGPYDYIVTGTVNPDTGIYPSGTVTFNSAPLAGWNIVRERNTPERQPLSLLDNARFPAKSVEGALDRLELQIQEMDSGLSRAIVAPASDGPVDLTLPPASARAGMLLGFDAVGSPEAPVSSAAVIAAVNSILAGAQPAAAGTGWAPTLAVAKLLYAASVTLANGQPMIVDCRSVLADGYGDIFLYDSADTVSVFTVDALGFTDAAGRRWKRQAHLHIEERWYVVGGISGDGVVDETAAMNAAITDAANAGHKPVHVGVGQHRITAPIVLHEGVPVIGVGGQGSSQTFGVVFVFEPAADGVAGADASFLWDGNGRFVAGTGGGMQNVLIQKNNSRPNWDAIKLKATDDNHRPGEMIFTNVAAYHMGGTSFLWRDGFVIDGTAANTPGAKGVRTTVMVKVRMASCSAYAFHFNQAVHVWTTAIEADQGEAADCQSLIEGDWDNIWVASCAFHGGLTINGPASPSNQGNISGSGRVSNLVINAAYARGALAVNADHISSAAKDLRIESNISDAFRGDFTTSTTNQTGDGTSVSPVFPTVAGNSNGAFDNVSTWTCKIAGNYEALFAVQYSSLGSAHTSDISYIVHDNGIGGILYAYAGGLTNPFACATGGSYGTFRNAPFMRVSRGDRVYPRAIVGGGAKTVGIYGIDPQYGAGTYFSVKAI